MKPRCIYLILSLLIIVSIANAKPEWVKKPLDSEYFVYFVGTGMDLKEFEAKEKALSNAMQKLSQYHLLQVRSLTDYREIIESTNDILYEYDHMSKVITLIGNGEDIRGVRVADEYTENLKGMYYHSVLIRLPKSPEFATMPLYKSFSLSPIIKSALLPGWGQITKNEQKKGHFIMITEGVSVLSALTFCLVGNYYQDRSRNISLSYSEQEICRGNANISYLYGNVSLTFAAGIYVYNLIDIASSKNNRMFTTIQDIPIQITSVSNRTSIAVQIRF